MIFGWSITIKLLTIRLYINAQYMIQSAQLLQVTIKHVNISNVKYCEQIKLKKGNE